MIFDFDAPTPSATRDAIRVSARRLRLARNMTQQVLAEKSGVPLSTLKRFEQSGEVSLAALLAIAGALDALDAFENLFPKPAAVSLDQLGSVGVERKRAGKRRDRWPTA